MITHRGVNYRDKLSLIAQSRVSVIHNLLFPDSAQRRSVKKIRHAKANRAFTQVFDKRIGDDACTVPQLKSRLFEAAFCRSLILCAEDEWNLVERFFEPEAEFIYFRRGELPKALTKVLANYSHYEDIIERAFRRAVANYTTEAFAKTYLVRPRSSGAASAKRIFTKFRDATRPRPL